MVPDRPRVTSMADRSGFRHAGGDSRTPTRVRSEKSPGKQPVRSLVFTTAMPPPERRVGLDRTHKRSFRATRQRLGRDLFQIRTDAAATHGQVARLADIDRSYYSRIESGIANPSIETLTAISAALGADVSIRFYQARDHD